MDINLEFLFRIVIETSGGIYRIPDAAGGDRIIVDVSGGTVAGPKVNGTVMPSGGDWGEASRQGGGRHPLTVTALDARLVLRTLDDATIGMTYRGIAYAYPDAPRRRYEAGTEKDPAGYYFRTTPYFHTGHPDYDWLNRIVAVATGIHRERAGPIYDVYQVL